MPWEFISLFAMPVVRLPKPPTKASESLEKGACAKQLQQFGQMSDSKQRLQSDCPKPWQVFFWQCQCSFALHFGKHKHVPHSWTRVEF